MPPRHLPLQPGVGPFPACPTELVCINMLYGLMHTSKTQSPDRGFMTFEYPIGLFTSVIRTIFPSDGIYLGIFPPIPKRSKLFYRFTPTGSFFLRRFQLLQEHPSSPRQHSGYCCFLRIWLRYRKHLQLQVQHEHHHRQ